MMNFAECNDRTYAVERTMIDAEDDAANMLESDSAREIERIQRRSDLSTALHEFILNARYEKAIADGRIVLR